MVLVFVSANQNKKLRPKCSYYWNHADFANKSRKIEHRKIGTLMFRILRYSMGKIDELPLMKINSNSSIFAIEFIIFIIIFINIVTTDIFVVFTTLTATKF